MSKLERGVATSVAEQLRSQARQAGWSADPNGWARDVLGVHMWSKQREISESVIHNKRTVVASCHGTGKALCVDTPIPTSAGMRRMGEIAPGDRVLGADGRPVTVVATTGVHTADRYTITLRREDGREREVIASGDHVWPLIQPRTMAQISVIARRAGIPVHTGIWHHRAVNTTTRDLFMAVRAGQKLAVVAKMPIQRPAPVPMDAWLETGVRTRGTIDPMGRACLSWTTRSSAEMPLEMIGMRARLRRKKIGSLLTKRRVTGGAHWQLALNSDAVIAILPNPDDRAIAWTRRWAAKKDLGWQVASVKKIEDGPVQCIQVDAPDNLYLCTEDLIPTHNSMIASVLACWWISTHPVGEAIVVSSAPTYAQVNKILWESIRRHHANAKHKGTPMIGRVTQGDEWKSDSGEIVAFGRKPADGDRHAFQGIHRRYVLVILDEACGIPEELWTGAEAITTNVGCRILAIGNPDDRNTEFGNNYLKPELAQDWNRISIPASATPNFTGEEVPKIINEVLVSREWAAERLRAWGADDPRYLSKVDAKFPEQSKSSLFPPAVVASASDEAPEQPKNTVIRLGVDVARFGTDQNVVVSYIGRTAKIEETWSGTDTVSSAHQVVEIAQRIKEKLKSSWVEIRVDAVGLGAGVVDTLNARLALLEKPWYSVYEMHGSASPPTNLGGSVHGYGNARAYWFDQLRQMMRNGSVMFEPDERISDDLSIIFYHFRNGRLFIMSKEDMRKLHGRSPDHADALAYATAPIIDQLAPGSAFSQDAEGVIAGLEEELDDSDMIISPF